MRRLGGPASEFSMSTTFERGQVTTAPQEVMNHARELGPRMSAATAVDRPEKNWTVILVAPEFLAGDGNIQLVRATYERAGGSTRLLARVRCATGLGVASELIAAGLPMDVLLAADLMLDGALPPNLATLAVRMPPGSTAAELNDFALALCDILLTGTNLSADQGLVDLAKKQRKPVISAGDTVPPLPIGHPDIAGWLHTKKSHWDQFGCHFAGRVEQFWLELFAFNWQGARYSLGRLLRCVSARWADLWPPYFAPEKSGEAANWRELAPDITAKDDNALIVRQFNSLDHSALYGAFLHRDLIWQAYSASAVAVFVAVMGSLWHFIFGLFWPLLEMLALVCIVAIIYFLRRTGLQDHWTSCRLAAEQLRIARLCLPLFVVPSVLASSDRRLPDSPLYTVRALEEVKRTVRDQGLPRPRDGFTPAQAASWLDLIIGDQALYHENNKRRLEHAEKHVGHLAIGLFLLAGLAVLVHVLYEIALLSKIPWIAPYLGDLKSIVPYLLIPTAAGPAGAAALHGVRTRLGIVHRIALSKETGANLHALHERLEQFKGNLGTLPPERAWSEIRSLAQRASNAMGTENTEWHNLVRRERDDIM